MDKQEREILQLCAKGQDFTRLLVWKCDPLTIEKLIERKYLVQDSFGRVKTTHRGWMWFHEQERA